MLGNTKQPLYEFGLRLSWAIVELYTDPSRPERFTVSTRVWLPRNVSLAQNEVAIIMIAATVHLPKS